MLSCSSDPVETTENKTENIMNVGFRNVKCFQEAVYFKKVSEIFGIAVGAQRSSMLPRYKRSNDGSRSLVNSRTLTARLAILAIRLTNFFLMNSYPTAEIAFIGCLLIFGWKATQLCLAPDSESFSSISGHVFWLLIPPPDCLEAMSEKDDAQFIADFAFKELFVVARPTNYYATIISSMRDGFVGTVNDLLNVVQALSEEAKDSLESQGLSFPPWRATYFLQESFIRGMDQVGEGFCMEKIVETSQDIQQHVIRFMRANEVVLLQLDFTIHRLSAESKRRTSESISFEKESNVMVSIDHYQSGLTSMLHDEGWGL
jgi:uncharacterized protein (TIGR01615 family)